MSGTRAAAVRHRVEHPDRRIDDRGGNEQDEAESKHVHREVNVARRSRVTVDSTDTRPGAVRRVKRSILAKLRSAFRTEDAALRAHDELSAAEALERHSAEQREELLVEGPVERMNAHSSRKTPTTRPRIWTWEA